MENRFGFKDFILITLLIAVLISIWLAMVQYNRQWDQLIQILDRLDQQNRDIIDIQRTLATGVATRGPQDQAQLEAGDDPFERIRATKKLEGYADGGTLVDAFGNNVGRLTPLISSDAYASNVQNYVLESLAERDPETLEWRPMLARDWRVVDRRDEHDAAVEKLRAAGATDEAIAEDESVPPAIQYIFRMRPNVRFSDGRPLTADDVVFTYQWIMNPAVDAERARAYYGRIHSVEKTGTDEVTFTFRTPYFLAFEFAAGMPILSREFYGQFEPEQFNTSVGTLLGSGPYRLAHPTAWRPGTLIRLQRNERYWGVNAAIEQFVWREIANDTARLASFNNGDIDVFVAQPEQYATMSKNPQIIQRANTFEYQNPIGGYRYVAWNQSRAGQPTVFADVRVRQAMTMLLNREQMIQQVMLGYAVQSTGPFNPLSNQYNPEVEPWPYDPQRAMAMLKEAGFEDRNRDGVLESPSGEPFQFRLTYVSGNVNYEKMALAMKDSLARAGIVLVLDPLDWPVLVERLNKKNFEAITLAWSAGIESDIYQMFHSSQVVEGGDNFVNYRSPRLDAVIDEARRTIDEQRRIPMWREAHKILHEEQPYTFLFFPKSLIFVDKRVHNVEQIRLGLNPRVEWFIPRAAQRTAD